MEARLYEDAGEDYGESRLTRLSGGLKGDLFVLERSTDGTLPLARDTETLRVYGLPVPKEVVGTCKHCVRNGAFDLTVDVGWQRLELRL